MAIFRTLKKLTTKKCCRWFRALKLQRRNDHFLWKSCRHNQTARLKSHETSTISNIHCIFEMFTFIGVFCQSTFKYSWLVRRPLISSNLYFIRKWANYPTSLFLYFMLKLYRFWGMNYFIWFLAKITESEHLSTSEIKMHFVRRYP